MNYKSAFIEYSKTGYFSKIVTDYISKNEFLKNFYQHSPDLSGTKNAIAERSLFNNDRQLLVQELEEQYSSVQTSDLVKHNISALLSKNTFTVCTAHQPNIFTGHLYFIYKIIHVIKLAETLKRDIPENYFVPVFYMGSEDADLEELGHIFINGEKYEWNTKQTGAVGRMIIDDELIAILERIKGQLLVEHFGEEIISLVKECYVKGRTIQDACFCLVNKLFADNGLIVLLPDNANLKRLMLNIFEDDIFNNTSSQIVNASAQKLSEEYKVQAHPREINLFYLKDGVRERIIKNNSEFKILNTGVRFTEEELRNELRDHPERFSPNVILRALYQETILPNILFVGGGGELAYWLELKDLFQHYKISYPVLVLRNSFSIVNENTKLLIKDLSLDVKQFFKSENELINEIVNKNSLNKLRLDEQKLQLQKVYKNIKNAAGKIDQTLIAHVEALLVQVLKRINKLETKMIKAEKTKFAAETRHIQRVRSSLFPNGELQERVENFMPFYAKSGKEFINVILDNSKDFEQEFCIIEECK